MVLWQLGLVCPWMLSDLGVKSLLITLVDRMNSDTSQKCDISSEKKSEVMQEMEKGLCPISLSGR